MNQRTRAFGLTGVTIGIAALGAGLLGAGPASADSGATLSYRYVPVAFHQTDVAPKGDSMGDTSVDLFRLESSGGRAVGDLTTSCLLVRAGAHPLAECQGEVVLPDGTLALAGVTTGSPDTTYAVTGGTGRYQGAGGVFRADRKGRVTITLNAR